METTSPQKETLAEKRIAELCKSLHALATISQDEVQALSKEQTIEITQKRFDGKKAQQVAARILASPSYRARYRNDMPAYDGGQVDNSSNEKAEAEAKAAAEAKLNAEAKAAAEAEAAALNAAVENEPKAGDTNQPK